MKTFSAPSVTDLGSVSQLTLGGSTGTALDATFPTGTPFSQVTFS